MTKCLENFVSQTLGFITRFCAAELRSYTVLVTALHPIIMMQQIRNSLCVFCKILIISILYLALCYKRLLEGICSHQVV